MSDLYIKQNEQMFSNKCLDCHICKDILLKPATLICGHSFCYHCIKNEVYEVINSSCPICKRFVLISPNVIQKQRIRIQCQFNDGQICKKSS